MQEFWMVWNEGNRGPVFKHSTEKSARNEAERLALQNRGQTFHVLKVIDSCRSNDVVWASSRLDAIPF